MPRSIIAPARRVNLLPHGIVGGLIAGVVIDVFLIVAGVAKFPGIYLFIASNVVGKAAFANASFIWLGLALHFAISAAWGALYALLARRVGTAMLDRPVPAGLLFGILVCLVMQVVLIAAQARQLPPGAAVTGVTLAGLLASLAAHMIFFGLPLALYVKAAVRRRVPA